MRSEEGQLDERKDEESFVGIREERIKGEGLRAILAISTTNKTLRGFLFLFLFLFFGVTGSYGISERAASCILELHHVGEEDRMEIDRTTTLILCLNLSGRSISHTMSFLLVVCVSIASMSHMIHANGFHVCM